jgi:hypothetical protein
MENVFVRSRDMPSVQKNELLSTNKQIGALFDDVAEAL